MKQNKLRLYFITFLLCGITYSAHAFTREVQGSNPALSAALQDMALEDDAVRERLAQKPGDADVIASMMGVDSGHEMRVVRILQEHGWPSKHEIGVQGLNALWLLIQHGSPLLLKESLPFMRKAVESGELPWSLLAVSIDRDLVNDGKKQRYGTQFRINKNRLEMYPIENELHLDELRKSVGLGSMMEYRAELAKIYKGLTLQ